MGLYCVQLEWILAFYWLLTVIIHALGSWKVMHQAKLLKACCIVI